MNALYTVGALHRITQRVWWVLAVTLLTHIVATAVVASADTVDFIDFISDIDVQSSPVGQYVQLGKQIAMHAADYTLRDGRDLNLIENTLVEVSPSVIDGLITTYLSFYPNLLGVLGPATDDSLIAALGSTTVTNQNIVFFGPVSDASSVRQWNNHVLFTNADPSTQLMALLNYAIKTVQPKRFGFMYLTDANVGPTEYALLRKQLSAMGYPSATVYSAVSTAALDEGAFSSFLQAAPQVTIIFGASGAHTTTFFKRLVMGAAVTFRDMIVLAPFSLLMDLTTAYTDLVNGGITTLLPMNQLVFSTTNPLASDTRFQAIAQFQTEMQAYFTANPSEASLCTTDACLAHVVRGWVTGRQLLEALNAAAATSGDRAAFQTALFQQSRYFIGRDIVRGDYSGSCDPMTASVGVVCECNQGGHLVHVNRYATDGTLSTVTDADFTFPFSECSGSSQVLMAPVTSLGLAVTDSGVSGNDGPDGNYIFQQYFMRTSVVWRNGAMTFSSGRPYVVHEEDTTGSFAYTSITIAMSESLISTMNGPIPSSVALSSASLFVVDPIPFAATLRDPASTVVYLMPTLEQELYVMATYLASSSYKRRSMHAIMNVVTDAAAITKVLNASLLQFGLSLATSVARGSGSGSLVDLMPANGVVFIMGLRSSDIIPLLTFLNSNTAVTVVLRFDDVTLFYHELQPAMHSQYYVAASRVLFATNLPYWTVSSDPEVGGTLSADFIAAVPEPVYHTPAAMRGFLLSRVLNTLSEGLAAPLSDQLHNALYERGVVRVSGLTFGPFTNPGSLARKARSLRTEGPLRNPDDDVDTTTTTTTSLRRQLSRTVHSTSANRSSSTTDAVPSPYAANDVINFGARQIAVWDFTRVISPGLPLKAAPITPDLIYSESPTLPPQADSSSSAVSGSGSKDDSMRHSGEEESGSELSAESGSGGGGNSSGNGTKDEEKKQTNIIIIAVVIGVVVVVVIVVLLLLFCCFMQNSRDNRNAPKDPALPVTLVFTDIQNSTGLWATAPQAMKQAVALHHSLIRSLIVKYKCYEVKTIGDAFMIACQDPFSAVQLARDVQVNFLKADWGGPAIDEAYAKLLGTAAASDAIGEGDAKQRQGSAASARPLSAGVPRSGKEAEAVIWSGLRIRIGVHTGIADIRYDEITKGYDYYGSTSNTAARTEGLGAGGQVLLTEFTYAALSEEQRAQIEVLNLGQQCLRGVPEPLEMYELVVIPGRVFPTIETKQDVLSVGTVDADEVEALEAILRNAERRGDCGNGGGGGGGGGGEDDGPTSFEDTKEVLDVYLSAYPPKKKVKLLRETCHSFCLPIPPRQNYPTDAAYADALQGLVAHRTKAVLDYRSKQREEEEQQQQLQVQGQAANSSRGDSDCHIVSVTQPLIEHDPTEDMVEELPRARRGSLMTSVLVKTLPPSRTSTFNPLYRRSPSRSLDEAVPLIANAVEKDPTTPAVADEAVSHPEDTSATPSSANPAMPQDLSPSTEALGSGFVYLNGLPAFTGDRVVRCFDRDNGLLFRIVDTATGRWGYYNDTKDYVMRVRFTLGARSEVRPLGRTTMAFNAEIQRYEGELTVQPMETAMLFEGKAKGFKFKYEAEVVP